MTITELYERFSEAKEWQRLAAVMRFRVRNIILKHYGETDANIVTREMLRGWLDDSKRPPEDTVPVGSVFGHMMTWAGLWNEPKPQNQKTNDRTEERPHVADVDHHEDRHRRLPSATKRDSRRTRRVGAAVEKPERKQRRRLRSVKIEITMKNWKEDNRKRAGTIEHDTSSKGYSRSGKRVFNDCWRAVIMVNGQRYRHRSETREECEEWLKAVKSKKILPTDNKADWWRMEQRKDDNIRIDEIIVSQAEEAVMLYDYHQSGDLSKINEYMVKRLLPHMTWYCAHTLQFGCERTITAARQAAALLLTRITAGKPVLNFTSTCKRMLRLYKQRGDFFDYEIAPEPVKILVNGMNLDGLAKVWKVTKDRRL